MNLRAKIDDTEVTEMANIWKRRTEKVSLRKEYEKDIDADNKLLTHKLATMLNPIATKVGGFYLTIREGSIEVQQTYLISRLAGGTFGQFSFSVQTNLPNIAFFLKDKASIRSFPKAVEKAIRILKKQNLSKKTLHHETAMLVPPKVYISINTATKYF